jgi:ABC-type polysaccharide/polyol phosphate export permease
MNWNGPIRRTHRTLVPIFTATLVITVVVLAAQGPEWVSYLPLPPLAFLFLSGVYLFVRPLVAARRDGAAADFARRADAGSPSRPAAYRVRQLHRWSAVAFTLTVLATIVALSLPEPIVWVSYLPLIPLTLLFFSGLYQFALPYLGARRRSAEVTGRRTTAA